MRILSFLLQKEFLLIFRNPTILRMAMVMPVVQLLILPWAATFEIKNISMAVEDHDQSVTSQKLVGKFAASGYFLLTSTPDSRQKGMVAIEHNDADLLVEIPEGFEHDMMRGEATPLMLSIDAVDGSKAGLTQSYAWSIVRDFGKEMRGESSLVSQGILAVPQFRFNARMNYQTLMVPGFIVMLLSLIGGALSSLNIVAEKESGTIEQMNVSPVKKSSFILAKMIPFWVIGWVVLTVGLTVARLVYGLIPVGSYFLIFGFGTVYLMAFVGFGMLISTYSSTQQQAMFVMYFFILIFFMLSGLFTPITSMPEWAQWVTRFNPVAYFVEVMRMVFLKGSGFADISGRFYALCGFAVLFNGWAVFNYRKSA